MHVSPKAGSGRWSREQKTKLEELAQYLYELIVIFEKDELGEPYQLLTRLFSEQCECSEDKVQVKQRVKEPPFIPYDPMHHAATKAGIQRSSHRDLQ